MRCFMYTSLKVATKEKYGAGKLYIKAVVTEEITMENHHFTKVDRNKRKKRYNEDTKLPEAKS